jgi:hypothetical protein
MLHFLIFHRQKKLALNKQHRAGLHSKTTEKHIALVIEAIFFSKLWEFLQKKNHNIFILINILFKADEKCYLLVKDR